MSDFYLFLNSQSNLFINNSPNKFRTYLNQPIALSEGTKVALTDIKCPIIERIDQRNIKLELKWSYREVIKALKKESMIEEVNVGINRSSSGKMKFKNVLDDKQTWEKLLRILIN